MTVKYVVKTIRAETKVLDAEKGLVEAVASTERADRAGDIIRQRYWDLADFLKHPVLLVNHNYFDVRAQIGEWDSMEVKGTKLVGVARYYIDQGNDQADWAFNLASKKRAAYSVGFIPDMDKAKIIEGGNEWFGPFEFKGQSLLEVSHVTVPANPDALGRLVKAAGVNPVIAEIATEVLTESGPQVEQRIQQLDPPALAKLLADEVVERLRTVGITAASVPDGGGDDDEDDEDNNDYQRRFLEAAQAEAWR